MAEMSKIGWTTHTFNYWAGCDKISSACDHCYAEVSTPARVLGIAWGPSAPRYLTSEENRRKPYRWERQHTAFFALHGHRQRVFCSSLSDWADNKVPVEWLAGLLVTIHAAPNLDWQLLTKRVGNIRSRLELAAQWLRATNEPAHANVAEWIDAWLAGLAPANVWLGITICNQKEADRDIPKLAALPAAVRFLSMEPLLAPVTLHLERSRRFIDWVIVGGESGPYARDMDLAWVRALLAECLAAGVAFFLKQLGGARDKREDIEAFPEDLRVRQFPVAATSIGADAFALPGADVRLGA